MISTVKMINTTSCDVQVNQTLEEDKAMLLRVKHVTTVSLPSAPLSMLAVSQCMICMFFRAAPMSCPSLGPRSTPSDLLDWLHMYGKTRMGIAVQHPVVSSA